TPRCYTLSLHDALPILLHLEPLSTRSRYQKKGLRCSGLNQVLLCISRLWKKENNCQTRLKIDCIYLRVFMKRCWLHSRVILMQRSEEHTSELQSPYDLV